MRSRLVWKLIAVVIVILAGAIGLFGYATNWICAHYSLESARAFLRFNSESIVKDIGQLMMARNNQGIEKLIGQISQDSSVYGDIRLISHHSGEVAASRFPYDGEPLEMRDRACAVCHDQSDPGAAGAGILDEVIDLPDGRRALWVMTPIVKQPACGSAACHAHAESPPILGFLNADYSLDRVDAMVAQRRGLVLATVLASLLLGAGALWWMFRRLLGRPIEELIAGTQRIAAGHLDFRFDQTRKDEIGVLEASFNKMTATIEAERDELRSAKEYLEGIVTNSADLIVTVSPDGLIETFNRGAEEALGYSRGEVVGRRIESLFADPRERDVAIARLKDTDNVKNYETHFLAKDGRVRTVLLTLSRLRDRQGNAIGTFGISKDITREKQLQQDLLQSQKFAAIGEAVTGIQHAMKNLLNSLKGGAYLVRNGLARDNPKRIREGWAMVEEGIERMGALSHSMLNYARQWTLELERADLGELVAKIYDLNRETAASRGVALRCDASNGLPPVLCDPKLIHLAATDILANAIDACAWKDYSGGERPEVSMRNYLDSSGRSLVIEIQDNGCGMNEEIRRNIFTPFFSTKNNRGTGLGLSLTARVIKLHAGAVSVESAPDQGSTFRIHLPIDGPKNSREADDGQEGARS